MVHLVRLIYPARTNASSSLDRQGLRPELAEQVLALRATKTTDDMLYLCDNQALLKVVQKSRWTGDGPKQTMVNAPNEDILREIIKLLKARVATGAATFLVKVKAH